MTQLSRHEVSWRGAVVDISQRLILLLHLQLHDQIARYHDWRNHPRKKLWCPRVLQNEALQSELFAKHGSWQQVGMRQRERARTTKSTTGKSRNARTRKIVIRIQNLIYEVAYRQYSGKIVLSS